LAVPHEPVTLAGSLQALIVVSKTKPGAQVEIDKTPIMTKI
jgi:hypothetical protein